MLHQVARISVFVALVLVGRCRSEGYYHVDECSNKTACVYSYSSEQESEEGGLNFNTSFTTTFTVTCESVGLLNGEEATEYCMLFQDTVLHYSKPENEVGFGSGSGDEDRSKDSLQNVNRLFKEKFCFYQTESGKIPEVYHLESEMADITNIKKSIAAAFQVNFKGKEEAVEEDPQSLHLSHYNISNNTDEGTLLMHRKITSEDVLKYSLDSDKEKVELLKDEDVEYRYGVLHHSSGNSTVVIAVSHHESGQEETSSDFSDSTYDGSKSLINKIKAQASYTLTLYSCSVIPPNAHRGKRSSSPGQNIAYSSLKAHVNETFEELHQLQELYGSLGSTSQVLKKLHSNTNDSDTANKLTLLLSLERKYNPKYRTPALIDVIKFLENLQGKDEVSDLQMRLLLYNALSSEGSLQAQMALFSSLLWCSDDLESRNIILDIALISEPHPLLVKAIERRIESVRKESDPLVLAYSTLGSKLSPEAKRSIVQFLKQKLLQETDGIEKVHLLHAFGNIGCNDSLAITLPYMDSDDLNVRMAATFALRKHISSPVARKKLKVALEDNEMIESVFEVLIIGTEYISSTVPNRVYQEKRREIEEDMIETLVNAVTSASSFLTNTSSAAQDLQSRVCGYIKSTLLSSTEKDSLNEHLDCHSLNALKIKKRGTDWDASNSDYNIVSPLSERRSDVRTYNHKAYIWGKKFGISDLNLQVGAGAFAGLSKNIPTEFGFKIFARAIGAVNILGRSATFFDAKLLAKRSSDEMKFVVYVSLIGDVLVNVDDRVGSRKRDTDCFRREWPIHQRSVRIFRLRFDVFIYVGLLTFSLDAYAQFRLTSRAASCCIENGVELSGALVPVAGISVQGSASASLLELVRGGIRITANIDYELEPKMSFELCIKDLKRYRTCLTVSHGWPRNSLSIYAYYQFRSVKMCDSTFEYPCGVSWSGVKWCTGRLEYPCGFSWGKEHRWDDLSASYNLGSSSLKKLWSSCGSQLSCPSSK